ncbi:MAG: hypothetical protein V3U74_06085, partial [Thermodesulfobacteriota bacterium]
HRYPKHPGLQRGTYSTGTERMSYRVREMEPGLFFVVLKACKQQRFVGGHMAALSDKRRKGEM